jgi:DNA polymerase-1
VDQHRITDLWNHEEGIVEIKKPRFLELLQEFASEELLSIDCETSGLDPHSDKVLMLQIGTLEKQLVIDTRNLGYLSLLELKKLLENPNIKLVGHNIKFDYNMLKQFNIFLNNVYDTMIIDRVIYNGKYRMIDILKTKRYSLAGVYKHHFNKTIEKEIRNEFQHWGSKPFTYEQIMYGAKDVIYPLEIYDIQQYWVKRHDLVKAMDLENVTLLSVGDIEYNGFNVDVPKWLNISKIYEAKIKKTMVKLDQLLIAKDSRYEIKAYQQSLFDVFERDRFASVNWNSDVQVYKILTETFGIYPEDKDGKPSSGTPALKLLDESSDIVDTLIHYRKEAKIISSFGRKFLEEHLNVDGRLRTNFNQIVDTGRMSSRNPNMQQIPKGSEEDEHGILLDDFRGAFTAPEGKLLITADYANQEGRVMADKANDKDYIHFFNYGDGDVHSFVATKLFSAAFSKEFLVTKNNENSSYRHKGKILNFMISFGGSAFTLSKTLKVPLEEAENLIKSFYKGFPTLKTMFNKNKKFALKHGCIRTNQITNRVRWIPEWEEYQQYKDKSFHTMSQEERSTKAKLKGRVERKGMNTPVQGTAGDMTKLALVLLRRKLMAEGIIPAITAPIKIVNVVHDEIVVEADKDLADLAAKLLKDSMEEAGKVFVKSVEMTTEAKILPYWDH